MADNLKPRSGVITDGPDRAPSRAMFKAVGFSGRGLVAAHRRRRQYVDRDRSVQLPSPPACGKG